MKKKQPELRMYFLCMYNLSDIQKSIQCLHATVEYQLKYGKDKDYIDWAKYHKTVILLNGGTSNDGSASVYGETPTPGTMETHLKTLNKNKIKCAYFHEPDANRSMTAIAFLVPETVFNKKDYPDFESVDNDAWLQKTYIEMPGKKTEELEWVQWIRNKPKRIIKYTKMVGKDVAFLKDFLKPFRLA